MTDITAETLAGGPACEPESAARRDRLALGSGPALDKPASASTMCECGFDAELLRLSAKGRRSSSMAMAALAVLAAVAAAKWAGFEAAVIWLVVDAAVLGIAYRFAGKLVSSTDIALDARSARLMFILVETLQGIIWAAVIWLIGSSADPLACSFALVLLLLVAYTNATVSAPVPLAVAGALTPMTAAILGFEHSAGLAGAFLPLIGLACGTQLYFMFLARKLHKASLETLSMQAEKDELIAELEEARANSELARLRAEAANLAKSRFLATVSHELRTPLNAILGFSEVMKGEVFGAHAVQSYKEYSSDIHASGQHLLMLINEILDLSRIEAGHFDLKEEAVALARIVEECRRLLRLRAKKRQITIEEAVEPDLPRIWADERAVRQVILNLLSNAIKFTPQGGTIKIKIGWTASGGQYVSVHDSGPGIPEDEIPIVMSPFGRGSLAQRNAEEGSGLGLPIAKGLVELHGGSLSLKSKLRKGTEVIVIFPPERIMGNLAALEGQGAGLNHASGPLPKQIPPPEK